MFQTLYNKLFKSQSKDLLDIRIDNEINKVIQDIKYLPNIESLENFDKELFYKKLTKIYPASFQYIDHKYHTLDMCEYVVNKIPEYIKYVKYQTIDMCKKAVDKKPFLIKYTTYETPDMVKKAIEYDHKLIENIKNQTLEVCRKVVSKDPYYFKFTKIQDIDMCKYACSRYPEYIKHCKVFDEELYIIVVSQDPYLIKYVNKSMQTNKIAIEVLNNSYVDITEVLKYIRTDILKNMDISLLYTFIYNSKDYYLNSPCCICLDDYVNGDILTNTICNHCYHKECLNIWLSKQNFCPMCNNIVV
jgi:hypothetical protein